MSKLSSYFVYLFHGLELIRMELLEWNWKIQLTKSDQGCPELSKTTPLHRLRKMILRCMDLNIGCDDILVPILHCEIYFNG